MKIVVQRVSHAKVRVKGEVVGSIGQGLLLLVGVETGDGPGQVERAVNRLATLLVFEDEHGHMNRGLDEVGGEILAVSQFTLAAETRKGTRPGFSTAAAPADGERLYQHFVAAARQRLRSVATGRFGARMQVTLINDGPVTFWLEVAPVGADRPAAAAPE